MSASVTETSNAKVWTDQAFMALPDDECRYEIVNGELVVMGNSGALHGYISIVLSSALFAIVSPQKLGVLFDSSTAFKMKNGNKRSPDISFFAKERFQGIADLPIGYLEGAPDLAVEILSPGNTVEEISTKLVEYFENGTRLVWVINPIQHYVLVYRSAQEPDRLLKRGDFLDGEDVINGFSFAVDQLFQRLSF
ncbi:MAG: Uma2 family endonuclease [Pseudanabaena sp.]|jgi:Uma2 family endonuclease|uniref:Uma2 family endonuclease n=1 Tax=Pseudanabaena mucicola TaxID=71190 RepID=UPI002575BD3D|nr:Uma2 family endonuclease [Pseudanabaena mucicola]MCA6553400.1 Uma2 family endonuclease [Pseudanabaena sp. M135S2SP2A07QC]MCA6573551.1 Uma2 family endonuclease [Pseudanabaena sp. M53BS1SP1A06MG]MCA6583686.1 Uma2 family endonuclease [Pseudanabaena sp. M34BS1SP1A06MG]MCA6586103.1 Uma2 family endonuclease [Pseudanabaena sp. M051S1SP1A06QC]MCA6588504.1 Uma2 family endonuclease [Pseudanabaena sp. M109S1SP1A06QC]MCA6591989.1 Uma2 family endonuclease [Pseudanabaena sp. M38BS1SP1A06MG]MCA6594959.1